MKIISVMASLALLGAGTGLGLLAQERVKPKGPPSFEKLHAAIKVNFDAKKFGKAYGGAKELVTMISAQHAAAVREAIPNAKGYEKVPFKAKGSAQQNMMAGLSFGIGNIIEQQFKGGSGRVQVTVTADSPLVQMFAMMATNPAMIKEGQELIKYSQGMALLETSNNRITFKMVLGKSMLESTFTSHDIDYVLGMWSQDAINALAHALIN